MARQAIIEKTIKIIHQLPDEKLQEISDFADFLIRRYEEFQLTKGVQVLTENSSSFDFLVQEEDIYSEKDLKEFYHAKR